MQVMYSMRVCSEGVNTKRNILYIFIWSDPTWVINYAVMTDHLKRYSICSQNFRCIEHKDVQKNIFRVNKKFN